MAIAYDISSNDNGSQAMPSPTLSSGNTSASATLGLVLLNVNNTSDSVSSATWDSQGMTKIVRATGGLEGLEIWGILNPHSGVKTIAASGSGTVAVVVLCAISYTGTNSSSLPSNFNSAFGTTGNSVSVVLGVDSTANSWVVGIAFNDAANSVSMSTGETIRQTNNGGSSRAIFDTNTTVTASANHTSTMNWTGNANKGMITLQINPAAAVVASRHGIALLGVGI